jgi:CubicO group peptidase (beta-lactamase class C family)
MKTAGFKGFLIIPILLCTICSSIHAANWASRHGLTPAQYQAAFDDFLDDGYRVKSLSGYTRNGQELYEALWVKNTGITWAARHAMTAAQYQAAFDDFYKKGYRLTCISGFGLNNQSRFAAVWEKKSGPAWGARHNLTASQYQDAFDDFKAKGYHIQQVCGYVINGQEYFAAIWDKAPRGAMRVRHNLTASQYQQAFNENADDGYVLTCVSGYTKGGANLYAAIWEKKSSPLWASRHGIPEMNYQHASDNMYYQGYVPTYLNAFASGSTARYNAIWENTVMKGSDIAHIDKAAKGYMSSQSVEGLSIAICKDGRLVFAKAYGQADKSTGEELSPNHSMRIMSISKPVTSAGIMKLYEQDKSLLKKKVFGSGGILGSKYPTPSGQSELNKITVEQLLWHTSGLISCNGESEFWDKSSTIADGMSVLMKNTGIMPNDTGAMYTYSNTGYYFLARIIEQLSGQSYENYIRNKVLTPSGIGNTMYLGKADGNSKSGETEYDPATKPNMQLWSGFGGWVARPMDLLKFLNRLDGAYPPSDIILPATHDVMTTGSRRRSNYALGWGVSGDLQNHNGCHGSTRSFLVELADGVSYAVIINTAPSNDDCGWTMKAEIETGLSKVSGYPSHNLF